MGGNTMKKFMIALLVVVLCGFEEPVAHGQETTATVSGFVTDATGAAIPNADVVLQNTRTGAERRVVTTANGEYTFTFLPVGNYKLVVQAKGFKQFIRQDVPLSVNEKLRLDVPMELGAITESVTVTSHGSALNTENATLSGLVDSEKVTDLPLDGRNFSQLINLEAGVSTNNNGNQGSGQFVNGSRGTGNNFLIDGGDANDPVVPNGSAAGVTAAFTGSSPGINFISVDAIQEFRVITSGASAEFGRNSGAQINVITKSGTNQIHGDVFEFNRNRVFDARSFFDTSRPKFNQNNFGGTIGGPIRRDKTFYFGSYEGFRQRQGVSVVNNIPSPNTIQAIQQQNPALGAIFSSVFTGPFSAQAPNDLSPQQIIKRGTPTLVPLSLTRSNDFDQNSIMAKVDQYLPRGARLTGRYIYFKNSASPGTVSGNGLPATGVGFTNRVQNAVLEYTQPFGGNKLNEFRFTFQRNVVEEVFSPIPQALLDSGKLRPGAFSGQPYSNDSFSPDGIPTINPGFGLPELGFSVISPNNRASTTFQLNDIFALTHGRFTIKFGGELRRIWDNSAFSFLARPNDQFASGGPNTILQSGTPVQFFTQNIFLTPNTSLRGFRITEGAPFVQTTTRITPNLTFEAGFRYPYFGPPSEVNGFLSNAFQVQDGSPLLGTSLLAFGPQSLNKIRLFPVGPGRGRSLFEGNKGNYEPRVGLAWSPSLLGKNRTTIRASYGIFHDRIFDNVVGNARNAPPFVVPVTSGGIPFGTTVSTPDPFTTTLPIGPTTVNPNLTTPITERWNFSLQRLVPGDMVLEVSYVGAHAYRLVRTINPNFSGGFPAIFRPSNVDVPAQPPVAPDAFRPLFFGTFSTRDTSASSTYNALQITLNRRFAQGLGLQVTYTYSHSIDDGSGEILTGLPLASVTNLLPLRNPDGTIPVPSLDIINKVRSNQGLPPFTSIADAASYFVQNFVGGPQLSAERGNSDFDLRHAAVINFNYVLPFGAGHRFGGGTTGLISKWISGWQTNGILRFQTGQPFSLLAGVDANGNGSADDRAALLAGRVNDLFTPGGGTDGNTRFLQTGTNGVKLGVSPTPQNIASDLPRNVLFGPGIVNTDFSIFKNTLLKMIGHENVNVQFRAEFFNLFNHTNFGNPVNNIRSPLFGQLQTVTVPGRQIQFGLKILF